MISDSKFVEFELCNKIWAVGSIHSNFESFEKIKKHIINNFSKNDKIVFLGNIIGVGPNSKEIISSLIELRRTLMSKYYLNTNDVVFLRGAQEEMFLKLLQLHTSPNPNEILSWMYEHGVDQTIYSYGINANELIDVSTQGTMAINKWISKLNDKISCQNGHREFYSNLHHAAFPKSKLVLFVNRGVDISRPLSAQSDCFWWGYHDFSKINKPYRTFKKIVRGYEPNAIFNDNNYKNKMVISLYKGPISEKKIIAGVFNDSGEILDLFESN